MHAKVLKLVVATPHPLEREMLVLRLSMMPEYAVCGVAGNVDDAARLIDERAADLAIVDTALKTGTGFDLIRRFKSTYPQLKMLVFSGSNDLIYAERMIRIGANGYVSKRQPIEVLLAAVRDVAHGQLVVHEGSSQQASRIDTKGHPKLFIDDLSDRELQVFELIGMGHPSRTIAEQLSLSRHTVDSHRENIKKKLGLKSSAELTRAAVHWQLEQM